MIYPVPQINNLNGKNISASSVSFCGDYKEVFEIVFNEYNIPTNAGITVNLIQEDSRETTFAEEISALRGENHA